MGRHSALDDEESDGATQDPVAPGVSVQDVAVQDLAVQDVGSTEPPPVRGRHGHPDEPVVDAPTQPPVPKGREGATHADLRLLREHAALRARCAAAVIVPFLLYSVLLVVIARTDVYLVWVWIPSVLAGVLVGSFLDQAHRHATR